MRWCVLTTISLQAIKSLRKISASFWVHIKHQNFGGYSNVAFIDLHKFLSIFKTFCHNQIGRVNSRGVIIWNTNLFTFPSKALTIWKPNCSIFVVAPGHVSLANNRNLPWVKATKGYQDDFEINICRISIYNLEFLFLNRQMHRPDPTEFECWVLQDELWFRFIAVSNSDWNFIPVITE